MNIVKITIMGEIFCAIAPAGDPPADALFAPCSDGDGYSADGWGLAVAAECGYGALAQVWVVRPMAVRCGDFLPGRPSVNP